jgi:hypothetical protein
MATHDVTLRSGAKPQFPDRCVGCELEHPGSAATVSVTGAGVRPSLLETALDAAPRSGNVRITVEVPACPKCARSLEIRHGWKTFWLYFSALGGVAVMIVLAGLGFVWPGIILMLACIAAPVIWELRSPPAFTITPIGERVIYEFRSELCAKEFQEKNPATP